MSEPQRDIPAVHFLPPEPHQVNGEPRHPDVRFEPTDVDSRAVIWFVVALAVGIIVVMLVLWGMFRLFLRTETVQKRSAFPVAVQARQALTDEQRLPPAPRLEGIGPVTPDKSIGRRDADPKHSIGRIRPSTADVLYREQEQRISEYAWVEKDKTARIPIEEAMKRLAEKRLGPKDDPPVGPRDDVHERPNQSGSGREPQGGQP